MTKIYDLEGFGFFEEAKRGGQSFFEGLLLKKYGPVANVINLYLSEFLSIVNSTTLMLDWITKDPNSYFYLIKFPSNASF